jgi:hypothetical protein
VPVDGRPVKLTLPVATVHVGWLIIPITGAAGTGGGEFITALAEAAEGHPVKSDTVNV